MGEDWPQLSRDGEKWAAAVEQISGEDIWRVHQQLKNLLIAFIRERTRTRETGSLDTIHEHKDLNLDPTNSTDYRGNPYPFGMDPVS